MKNLKNRLAKVLSATFLLMLSGCADDLTVINSGGYDDGPATLTLNVAYNPLIEGLGTTRGVDANLDFELRDITVVFYKENADEESDEPTLVKHFTYNTDYTTTQEGRPSSTTEPHTRHAEMTIKDIEPGSYRIYAIANVNDLAGFKVADIEKMSEKTLREKKIDWNGHLSGTDSKDPRTYNIPDAMFGYFHEANYDTDHKREADSEAGTAKQDVIHHDPTIWNYDDSGWTNAVTGYEGNGDSKKGLTYDDGTTRKETISSLNRAGVISVTGNTIIHAWLKRTISRLTIGYDGSQLRPGVEIYVKSVRIRDAVSSCLLGHDNQANKTNSLLLTDNPDQDNRLNIKYSNAEGAEAGKAITSTTPAFPRQTESIATKKNGQWNSEWYDYVHGSPAANAAATLDPAADPDANTPTALYFMENLQGKETGYTEDDFKEGKYPKSYREGRTSEASSWEWDKDKKDYGTYIEVDAYYINKREKTQGKITYRFMLGQNITDDFNAERNRHYKLTLSFIGDANNPDWHIEYEPEPSLPYFRIPYNLGDDDPDCNYSDLVNDEWWYKNENWNQSYVWYAYYDDGNGNKPIAEICKELIYYDNNYTDTDVSSHKFYQVVTVYPIKEDGTTDLENGFIAQVLDCDDINETATQYYTKTGGAAISMYYRYQMPGQYTNKDSKDPDYDKNTMNGDKAQCVRYTIKSCEITPNIANGTDAQSHENYWYIKYDPETRKLTPIVTPLNVRLDTRPYLVKDKDNNKYPIVKIGASYWFRENLRTTSLYSANEIIGLGSSTNYFVSQYENGINSYAGYESVYFKEAKAMYKTLFEDNDGTQFGYLYNLATIMGSEESDPWIANEHTMEKEWDESGHEGDHCQIIQFENQIYDRSKFSSWLNEWQITPKGWHIPTGELGFMLEDGTRTFGEIWHDNQYILYYMGNNFFRGTADKDNLRWPHTSYQSAEIKKKNLSGLSLLAIPANGSSTNLSYDVDSDIKNANIDNVIVAFWTDLCQVYKKDDDDCENKEIETDNLHIFGTPPIIKLSTSTENGAIESEELLDNHGSKNTYSAFYQKISECYLPIRPCRHSFEKTNNRQSSYAAQTWDAIGNMWTGEE